MAENFIPAENNSLTEQTLSQRDAAIIWHPFTQHQNMEMPMPIAKGKGAYLYNENGNKYLDLISSWWVNLHGHCHPYIAKAISQQARQLEHVIFAGFTHNPAVTLCEQLLTILPKNLQRFFFSDNGSTAVEVAVKMAYQYFTNHNQENRTRFLAFEGGYHGDTFGAMSLGAKSGFHNAYKKLFFSVTSIPYPSTWQNDEDVEKKEQESITFLKDYLQQNGNTTSALIIEPLIQGASGMRFCRPQFLQKVISMARSYGIIIIFDEVMTGFGRTGHNFALEHVTRHNLADDADDSENNAESQFSPDIICLSKGLTGGFLPMALTITSNKIYQAFLDSGFNKAFAHGHSYTANPLGCAAAIASLNLLLSPATQKNIAAISAAHNSVIPRLQKCPNVIAVRSLGTIIAFNLQSQQNNYSFPTAALKKKFLHHGLLLRPLGNTVYIMPPYCIKTKELQNAYKAIIEVISDL